MGGLIWTGKHICLLFQHIVTSKGSLYSEPHGLSILITSELVYDILSKIDV